VRLLIVEKASNIPLQRKRLRQKHDLTWHPAMQHFGPPIPVATGGLDEMLRGKPKCSIDGSG
jgi:hypothetical protein